MFYLTVSMVFLPIWTVSHLPIMVILVKSSLHAVASIELVIITLTFSKHPSIWDFEKEVNMRFVQTFWSCLRSSFRWHSRKKIFESSRHSRNIQWKKRKHKNWIVKKLWLINFTFVKDNCIKNLHFKYSCSILSLVHLYFTSIITLPFFFQ